MGAIGLSRVCQLSILRMVICPEARSAQSSTGAAAAQEVTINLGYAAAEISTYGVLADTFEELAER